jgi:hypothetical protein
MGIDEPAAGAVTLVVAPRRYPNRLGGTGFPRQPPPGSPRENGIFFPGKR